MSARAKKPTGKPPRPPASAGSQQNDPSEEQKTTIFDSGRHPRQEPLQGSGQLQMISMKTPSDASGEHKAPHKVHQVKMRAISEVTPLSHAQPQNMGYLAPPRDASEVRTRHFRDYVIWGCLSVILASAIALGVWFLGR